MSSKQFGGKITKTLKERYALSPNWKDGAFTNLESTQTAINWRQLPGILCKQIKGHKEGYPKQDLPIHPFDLKAFEKKSEHVTFIWYGHAVLLMRIGSYNILIDPMLGSNASPIGPIKTKRFSSNTLPIIDDLPTIDLLLITHDHYDHLDYDSIQKLMPKVKFAYVALGVKRHLVSWGMEENTIEEFDWWDQKSFHNLHITFTPTRHFSGRGLTSLAKCLWGGWAIKTPHENIWFSGDGGYGAHFEEVGKRLGPFDIGFIECGQYSEDWPQIHMFPQESVQAALDAGVQHAVPVHWAGFNLSYAHSWYGPVEAFLQSAQKKYLNTLTPELGKIFTVQTTTNHWWNKHK